MEYTIEEESKKIIELRDSILNDEESYNDPEFIRLKIEKKLRDEVKKTSSYGKYLKNGRVDLIDPKRRNQMITPINELQAAFYENYKPRKDREMETNDRKRIQYEKPVTASESFYDDGDVNKENISQSHVNSDPMKLKPTTTGVKPQPQQTQIPLQQQQQQFQNQHLRQSPSLSQPQFQQSPSSISSNISTPIQNYQNFANIPPPPFIPLPNFPIMNQVNQLPQLPQHQGRMGQISQIPQMPPMPQVPQVPQNLPQQWAFQQQQQQVVPNQAQAQQMNPFIPFPFLPMMQQMNTNNNNNGFQQPQQQSQQQPYQSFLNYQQSAPQQTLNYGDGSDSVNTNRTNNGQNRPLQPY